MVSFLQSLHYWFLYLIESPFLLFVGPVVLQVSHVLIYNTSDFFGQICLTQQPDYFL